MNTRRRRMKRIKIVSIDPDKRNNQFRREDLNHWFVRRIISTYREYKSGNKNRSELRSDIFKEFRNNSYNASVSDFIKEIDSYMENGKIKDKGYNEITQDFNEILTMLQRNWSINKLMSEDGGS